jgi:hypothetical protein
LPLSLSLCMYCICICIRMCVCMCVHTYVYIHTYVCMVSLRTYIHTCASTLPSNAFLKAQGPSEALLRFFYFFYLMHT